MFSCLCEFHKFEKLAIAVLQPLMRITKVIKIFLTPVLLKKYLSPCSCHAALVHLLHSTQHNISHIFYPLLVSCCIQHLLQVCRQQDRDDLMPPRRTLDLHLVTRETGLPLEMPPCGWGLTRECESHTHMLTGCIKDTVTFQPNILWRWCSSSIAY